MENINKSKIKAALLNVLYPLIAAGIILAVWAIAAAAEGNYLILPSPGGVIKKFFTLGGEPGFWLSVLASLLRTLICFITSFVLALLLASLGGICSPLHRVISPIVTFFRAAPTVAVILIMYAFLNSSIMAVVVGFLIAFPVMYSAFYSAVTSVDKDLLEMADVYRVSPINKVKSIYLPSIASCLFDTSRSTLSLTFKVIIASEILTSVTTSIGGKIQVAYASFEISYLLAWTLIAIVFSFVLEGIVLVLKKIWEVRK